MSDCTTILQVERTQDNNIFELKAKIHRYHLSLSYILLSGFITLNLSVKMKYFIRIVKTFPKQHFLKANCYRKHNEKKKLK